MDKLQKRVEKSFTATTITTAFVKQLQQAAKIVEEDALLEDPKKEQEDNNISNLSNSSDEDSLNKDTANSVAN